jgi:hypothetical protein
MQNGESPDADDRVQDFWKRHGGPAARPRDEGTIAPDSSGWSEVYAADGYTLRCEWSRMGTLQEMRYIERPPAAT